MNQCFANRIVESIVRMTEAFRCKVIAEGVESDALCQALLELGCSLAQGCNIAQPMPAEAMAGWEREWRDR